MYLEKYSKAQKSFQGKYYQTKISALLELEHCKLAATKSKNLPASGDGVGSCLQAAQ